MKDRTVLSIVLALLVTVLPVGIFAQDLSSDDVVDQVNTTETTMISGVEGYDEANDVNISLADSYMTDEFDEEAIAIECDHTWPGGCNACPDCYWDGIARWCVCW